MKSLIAMFALTAASYFSIQAQPCAESAKVVAPAIPRDVALEYSRNLEVAARNYTTEPTADNLIWYARRKGYLGHYKDAIESLTIGIEKFPNDARLYRHRGHRYITLRCFDDAIKDLEKAANLVVGKPDEVEPDGLPNARNVPTSTLEGNIEYHLGLAYYLKGDWGKAAARFMNSYNIAYTANSPDMKIASVHWVFMCAARYGVPERRDAERLLKREIKDDEDIIENHDYYKLVRLYKGQLKAEDLLREIQGEANTLSSASLGYGLGNWYLYNGKQKEAMKIFRQITAGNQWASFGYIAAEAELARQP